MVLMSKHIYCSECGQACLPEAKFCFACGKPLQPIDLKVDDALEWTRVVYHHLRAREATVAEILVRKRLSLDPCDATAYALLGTSLFAQYKVDDAGEAFHKAVSLPPDNFIVRMEYALFLGRLARYGDAMIQAERAMNQASNRSDFERADKLYRIAQQKSQGNFIHQSSLPSFSWLKKLFKS